MKLLVFRFKRRIIADFTRLFVFYANFRGVSVEERKHLPRLCVYDARFAERRPARLRNMT